MIKKYIYVFVRKDLSPEQRAVQSAHAAFESGSYFKHSEDYNSPCEKETLILIGVKNERELQDVYYSTVLSGIRAVKFGDVFSNGWYEHTAFATEPIEEKDREKFSIYKTLRYERGILYHLKVFIRSIKRELLDF